MCPSLTLPHCVPQIWYVCVSIVSLQSPSTVVLEPKERNSHCFHLFLFYLPWSDGTRCCDLRFFLILTFKPAFSLTSSILIKRLSSSSLLSAIRMISSVYLMLLFLLGILIPACEESNPTFLIMQSAYKLNKQGDDIHPRHSLFLILNQSFVLCKVLIVSS